MFHNFIYRITTFSWVDIISHNITHRCKPTRNCLSYKTHSDHTNVCTSIIIITHNQISKVKCGNRTRFCSLRENCVTIYAYLTKRPFRNQTDLPLPSWYNYSHHCCPQDSNLYLSTNRRAHFLCARTTSSYYQPTILYPKAGFEPASPPIGGMLPLHYIGLSGGGGVLSLH